MGGGAESLSRQEVQVLSVLESIGLASKRFMELTPEEAGSADRGAGRIFSGLGLSPDELKLWPDYSRMTRMLRLTEREFAEQVVERYLRAIVQARQGS